MPTTLPCPICLMEAPLPDTLPFRQHPRCGYCGTELLRYLPCPHCEQNFNPALPACPGCGVRPPDEAIHSPVWQIADRVVAEAIFSLREEARRTYEAARAAKSAAKMTAPPAAEYVTPKHNANGGANGHGNGNGGVYSNGTANGKGSSGNGHGVGKKSATPGNLPALTTGANGAAPDRTVEAPVLPPGLQQGVVAANGAQEDGPGALFEMGGPEITSSAATITADFELITEHARLADLVAELAGSPILAVDTETTGLDPFVDNTLLLVQIATQERAYVVDARRVDPRPLRRILEDERTLKLLQNAKFDYKMLRQQLGIKMRNMYDTMLAERVLTAGISREIGLARLAEKYAGITMDKSVRTSFIDKKTGDFSQEQLRYAARDVLVLYTIYAQQRVALKKEKLLNIADLEFKTVVAVGEMELAGCRIDVEHWRKIIEDNKTQRDRTANELGELLADAIPQQSLFGGPAINLNSNAQLIETLGRMGLELPDTMEATLLKYDHPAIKKLLEYRGFEKTISAFGEKFLELIHPKTGRIHPDFNQLGADTGRFSCTNPNVQQIPATSEFRSCFVASPGYKLITCDYSQAELRILAQLSEDPAFVDAFRSGGDLHQLTASQMFQIPPDQIQKPQRSAAKVINFGLAYGRGPAALGVQLGVSTEEARRLIDQYFKAYSGIQQWLDRAAREAVRKGYSVTMMGRKRYYAPLDRDDPDYNKNRASVERQGKNSPIQGCLPGHVRIFEQSRGYVPIQDLCGQEVVVWDGHQFARALVAASGPKQLVRVTLWGGHAIECSPDHRFLVRDPNGRFMWKTPGEFRPQHRVMLTEGVPAWIAELQLPPIQRNGSWNARSVSVSQISDPVALGEWLGRVASDGSLCKGYVAVIVAEHEEMLLPQLVASSAQLTHVGHTIRVTATQPGRLHQLTVSSRGLVEQLQAMGLKERIPDVVWQDSRVLSGYLRGMFDGDGTVVPDGAILVFGQGLTHLKWAGQIQQALLLFGVRSRVRSYPGDRTVVQVLKKDMPLFAERIGFMNPIKQAKASAITCVVREKTYGRGARVQQVEVTDTWVEMYDVVNSETGRFMANGLIVHNSNADMTKLALIGLTDVLPDYNARVVNTVHDEIVVEAPEDQAELVCKIVEREMVKAGQRIISLVPIVADAKIGDYWSK